jgi:O-antigen/teichoic acid export membrane protein
VAFVETKIQPARHLIETVRARFAEWKAHKNSLTQRMAFAAFAIRMASAAIMFVSQILLARWMGDYQFGTYVYVWTWLLMIGEIVHLGVPLTAQRFVPEYSQGGAFDLLRGYLTGSRWLTFGFATVTAIIGALIVHGAQRWIETDNIMPFYFGCVALPFYAFTFMTDGLARSYNWIGVALLPPYILRPLVVIAVLATLHRSGVTLDATVVTGVLAGSIWFTALIQHFQLERGLRGAVPPGPKTYAVRRWLATSLPIILVWGFYTLLTSTDILVLMQFRSAQEVAHYYAAAKTLALVSIIYFAVAAAAAHRFTALHVSGDRAGLVAFAASTVRWIFWPSLAVTLAILIVGRPVLMLFGRDFAAGYPFMAILALGQLARGTIGPAERLLNMLNQQRICALAYAAAFTVNIVGCLVLTPVYGGIGAACATAMAFLVETILLFLIAHHRLGLHLFILKPRAWPHGKFADSANNS